MKYYVKIKEYLEKVVEIEANNEKEAESIIKDQYYKEQILLDFADWIETEFEVIE